MKEGSGRKQQTDLQWPVGPTYPKYVFGAFPDDGGTQPLL